MAMKLIKRGLAALGLASLAIAPTAAAEARTPRGPALWQVSDKDNRPVAIILGPAIGAIIGAKIGQEVENGDRGCMGHALELAGEKKTVAWTNKTTGVTYRMTPTRGFKENGLSCREFVTRLSEGWDPWPLLK